MTPSGPSGTATAIDPRIRQRREEIERTQSRRRWRRLWVGAAAVVLVALVVLVLHTPWFGVRVVTVTGSHPHTSDAAIVAAAELTGHPSLISVDPGATAGRIESLPFIATAEVHRHWPDGISIAVTEREPVLTMAGPGAGWAVLDAAGRTLAISPARPANLVVLIVHAPAGPVPPEPVGGTLPSSAEPGLTVARDAATCLRRTGLLDHDRPGRHGHPRPLLGTRGAAGDRHRPSGQVRGHRRDPRQRGTPRHPDHRRHRAAVADGRTVIVSSRPRSAVTAWPRAASLCLTRKSPNPIVGRNSPVGTDSTFGRG